MKIGERGSLREGHGIRFKIRSGEAGFAIEHAGRVYAYLNHCPHLGVELDWAPGEFFDSERVYLICSTHGARFEPNSGRCVSGPCAGQSLHAVPVEEEQGMLYILSPTSPTNHREK